MVGSWDAKINRNHVNNFFIGCLQDNLDSFFYQLFSFWFNFCNQIRVQTIYTVWASNHFALSFACYKIIHFALCITPSNRQSKKITVARNEQRTWTRVWSSFADSFSVLFFLSLWSSVTIALFPFNWKF